MTKLTTYDQEILTAAGIDVDGFGELIGWLANEWSDGVCQSYCTDAELEAGQHYKEAFTYWTENPTTLIAEWRAAK